MRPQVTRMRELKMEYKAIKIKLVTLLSIQNAIRNKFLNNKLHKEFYFTITKEIQFLTEEIKILKDELNSSASVIAPLEKYDTIKREIAEKTELLYQLNVERDQKIWKELNKITMEHMTIGESLRIKADAAYTHWQSYKNTKPLLPHQLEANMEDVCGICLEIHQIKDTFLTACKHTFGKQCFANWTGCCDKNKIKVSCPTCRKYNPRLFTFRECERRDIQKPKRTAAGAIGNAEYLLEISQWRELKATLV